MMLTQATFKSYHRNGNMHVIIECDVMADLHNIIQCNLMQSITS